MGGAAAVAGGEAMVFPADLRRLSIEERLVFMFAGRGAIERRRGFEAAVGNVVVVVVVKIGSMCECEVWRGLDLRKDAKMVVLADGGGSTESAIPVV